MAFSENPLVAMDQDPLRITVKDEWLSPNRKPHFTHPHVEQTIRVKQEEIETQRIKVEEDPLSLPDMKTEAEKSSNLSVSKQVKIETKLELSEQEHCSSINQPCREEYRPTFVAFSPLTQHLLASKKVGITSRPTENQETSLQVPEAVNAGEVSVSILHRPCVVPPSLCNSAAEQRNIDSVKDFDSSTEITLRGLLGLPTTGRPTTQNKIYKQNIKVAARCTRIDSDSIDLHVRDINRSTETTSSDLPGLTSTSRTTRPPTQNKIVPPRSPYKPVAATHIRARSNELDALDVHWEQEQDGKFICKICSYKLLRKDKIKDHIRMHLNIKLFGCQICSSKFISNSSLLTHLNKVHEKRYKCAMCSRKFVYEQQWKDHANFHKGLRPYKCKICSANFTGKLGLQLHANQHKPKPAIEPCICEECGKLFKEKIKLRNHVNIVHRATHQPCTICHKAILNALFQSHKVIHGKNKNAYTCDICSKSFARRISIRQHITTVHAVGRYKCTECEKRYKTPEALKDHMLSHQGIRKYCCSICGKTFASAPNLDTHKFVHREKNFVCHICDAKFNRNDNLKSHVKRMHENKKPVQKKNGITRSIVKKCLIKVFKCSTCEKSFNNNKLLKEHFLTHDERYSVCDFCAKPYLSKAHLSNHIKNVHLNNCG